MYVYYVFISRYNIIKLDRLSRLSLGNPSLNPLSLGIVPKDRGTDRDEALKKRENFSSAGSTGPAFLEDS